MNPIFANTQTSYGLGYVSHMGIETDSLSRETWGITPSREVGKDKKNYTVAAAQ